MNGNDPAKEVAAHCSEIFAAITDIGILHPRFEVGEIVDLISHTQTAIAAFIRLKDFDSEDLTCDLSTIARSIRSKGIKSFTALDSSADSSQ